MNDTIADKASSAEEGSQVDDTNDQQVQEQSSEATESSQTNDASQTGAASDAGEDSANDEDASQASAEEAGGDEPADADSEEDLDSLFLSPDEDSEGVIEVEYEQGSDDGAAQAQGAEAHQAEVAELQEQLDQLNERAEVLEAERGDFKERWMRSAADLENLRKRAKREKEEQRKYGNDKLALELLPAVDNLERALAHAEGNDDNSSIVDGVKMVYRQIVSGLEKHGITGFEAKGEKFNPEQHEAIQQVETSEHDTGTVVEQYQKGYFIHDRLLRPALVSVAKRVAGGDNETQSEASEASGAGESGESQPDSADAGARDSGSDEAGSNATGGEGDADTTK